MYRTHLLVASLKKISDVQMREELSCLFWPASFAQAVQGSKCLSLPGPLFKHGQRCLSARMFSEDVL